jgi:uncharacterized protein YdeI (YjbR/CyaY-like superfamily)
MKASRARSLWSVSAGDDVEGIPFATTEAWERWLEDNHAEADGVWVKIAKKGTGIESVRYPEVLIGALCFGWIDARRQSLDEQWFLQRFTPRRSRSPWSKINRDHAERLIAEGRMRPAGLAEVERAKADGRWDAAYDGQARIAVPEDLQAELDARPGAKAFFDGLDSRNRYAILYRLQEAKKPETRARRLGKFVAMLEAGEKVHP